MRIKIEAKNTAAIEAALKEVNGKAHVFAITSYVEVCAWIGHAEARLEALPKAMRAGAVVQCTSSGPLAIAYGNMAQITCIQLERGARAWYLTCATKAFVKPKSGDNWAIIITAAQAEEIKLRSVQDFTVKE